MIEYHFIILNNDFSRTFLIAPEDIYLDTLESVKKDDTVASFFVIKGECLLRHDNFNK